MGCDACCLSSGFSVCRIRKNDADTNTLHSLAPIVVTAQQGNDANGLIVHTDPKQPIQPVPATDGADYLQSIMGFNSIQSGGTNGDVTFRGMFGSRIKILTDGTENLGACPNRMDAPTSYISPESYDRISVIKGHKRFNMPILVQLQQFYLNVSLKSLPLKTLSRSSECLARFIWAY